MKRVILILVLLLFISVPLGVTAERIDFSGLSLDALIMLKTWINEEIAARTQNGKEVYVPMGQYIVGSDIPCGTYTITNKDSYMVGVSHLSSTGEYIKVHAVSGNNCIGKIVLQDGERIDIQYGPVYFSIYKGLGF